MNNPSGSSGFSFLNWLLRLFRKPVPPTSIHVVPPDNTLEPVRIVTTRVLLAIFDPIMDKATGVTLSHLMHWQSPDDLANSCIQDILEASGGMARYQIARRVELNEFPVKTDGYCYDPQTYLNVVNSVQPAHMPEGVDYQSILTRLNVLPLIAMREIDEVWLFAFPHAGFYESTMGGAGAFWCNSEPMVWSSGCARRFIVMGFSFERGVGEMLESFGHRAESLVSKVFDCQQFMAWAYKQNRVPAVVGPTLNSFQQFICFDQVAPGKAGVGTIHYAPNSVRDYDWNNQRFVPTSSYDWYNYPKFQNDVRQLNCSEWGNGDIRAHHKWWLKHLPKAPGRTNGVVNNWWQYIMDPTQINI